MCGIIVLWTSGPVVNIEKGLTALGRRGPDITSLTKYTFQGTTYVVGFTRLHIQGSPGQEQPFSHNGRITLCNGEIFNSETLIKTFGLRLPAGASDCAVIPAIMDTKTLDFSSLCRQLDGDFAIVDIDIANATVRASRDPYGVRPLFYAEGLEWRALASEIKAFPNGATKIEALTPGESRTYKDNTVKKRVWHQTPWLKTPYIGHIVLQHALIEAVNKRMSTVREIGACLSGGLDSSLVAALAAKTRTSPMHTYSIGMEGSPDLAAARIVAEHIGSIHHERVVTAEECLAIIPEVIHAIESYDITTVRASVGNYLLGKFIASETPAVKVVLNGDGADEILGGYLYMRAAPNDATFEVETDRLLREIHQYDVLRSERSMASHGLESRSPFLDRQFVATARAIPTSVLRPSDSYMEKSCLRMAFEGLLPEAILWRRKEAFSDGISRAENSWFHLAADKGRDIPIDPSWTVNTPLTPEAVWYRHLFHQAYPVCASVIPAMWMPRFVNATDPSARTLELYNQ